MKHIPAHRQNSARPKDAHTESITIDGTEPAPRHPRRRKAVALVASAFVLAGGGTAAYASTVKTVDLDVDGKTATVSTAAGSVGGVLASEGIDVDTRDLVAPGVDTALEDGDEIVVRTADEVTIEQDGDERSILTTSVDAEETIERYSERAGEDVRLVASRSDADGRAELPIELDTDAPVTVEADGDSVEVDDSQDVDTVLDEAGVELGDADRVVVEHDDSDAETPVSVVVERVESSQEERTETIDFESTTVEDPDMYVGESEVRTEGEAGERTIVEDVVTRDGEEISREEVSNEVTTEPVDEVIAEGSKELPGGTPASNKELGLQMAAERGWTGSEATCLDSLWTRESGWDENAANPTSSAFGIPQALPGSKMASAGADWATNPATQIAWGLDYIAGSYGSPCSAWAHSESVGWY